MDLKKLQKLKVSLPGDFETSVWKTIDLRTPQRATANGALSWGDLLWAQPAWLGGLICAVLLTGMALGQFHATNYNDNANQQMTDVYVNSLDQGEGI